MTNLISSELLVEVSAEEGPRSRPIDRLGRAEVVMNARVLSGKTTGVQRYAAELRQRLGDLVECVNPSRAGQGYAGHLWEQGMLPFACDRRLLFSPGNTGPLAYRNQVVTIHDASTFDHPEAFQGAFGHWYRWLLPNLARRVRGVITVSAFSRERLIQCLGLDPDRVKVIYNGVTEPPATPAAAHIAEVENRLALPKRFFLFVGSNDPRKNLIRLIEGFAQAGLGEIELLVAGGDNQRLFAARQMDLPRGVRMLGRVSEAELELLYRKAEAFVFPSLYEGFGLPPLEAMARGCPVLCSDSACLPEVCGLPVDAGGACVYFDAGSAETIAAALRGFVGFGKETKQHMIEGGRKQAAKYSWDRCARETWEFLQHCASRDGRKFQ